MVDNLLNKWHKELKEAREVRQRLDELLTDGTEGDSKPHEKGYTCTDLRDYAFMLKLTRQKINQLETLIREYNHVHRRR